MTKIATVSRLFGRNRGFSMAGVLIGTLVMGVVAVGGQVLYTDYKQDQLARGRAMQLGNGLAQLESFARKFNAQLTAGQAITGVANTAAPTTVELNALGFSAEGFADATQPGGPIVFRIAREPVGCAAAQCILSLAVVTSGSVQARGAVDAAFAQKIAGYVGGGAGWSNLAGDATKLGRNGLTIPNPVGATPAVVAAVAWLGNNQASQTVPPVTFNLDTKPCGSGYTGSRYLRQSVTTDKWGNTSTGPWVTFADDCTAIPPPPTPPPVVAPPVVTDPPPTVCPNGASDYPVCTPVTLDPPIRDCPNGARDYPTCTPPVCPNGAQDYPVCTPPVCTNGASNYPTCTVTPPPVTTCTYTRQWEGLYSGRSYCAQVTYESCTTGGVTTRTEIGRADGGIIVVGITQKCILY